MSSDSFRRLGGRVMTTVVVATVALHAMAALGCDDARPADGDAGAREDASSREASSSDAPSNSTDGAGTAEVDPPCEPAPAERRACRPPLDTTLCPASWDELAPPPCGLRVYVGPIGDNWIYYVSYADIPPLGGPSIMCVYDSATQALTGAWTIGDYLHWCCQSSLDLYQGSATDELISAAVGLATHPPCADTRDGDDADGDGGSTAGD